MRTETKVQIVISLLLIIVLSGTFLSLFLLKEDNDKKAKEDQRPDWIMYENESYSVLSFLRERDEGVSHNLLMKMPSELDLSSITFENDPLKRVFSMSIPGLREDYFRDFYMAGSKDELSEISFEYNDSRGLIKLFFKDMTEVLPVKEDNYLCFDYMTPQEYYDSVVVLDAGGGGIDTGATVRGSIEKDINLSIALKLKEAFSEEIASRKIGIYCTREDDSYINSEDRVAFAKTVDADLLLSVHCASTASGRESDFSGTRVLYRVTDETDSSRTFASLCLSNLVEKLSSKDRGLVAGDEDYLVREAAMPVALCEIGYMTNIDELSKLNDAGYQSKAARALYEAVLEMLDEKEHGE